jgi:RHS repeat-associated protein
MSCSFNYYTEQCTGTYDFSAIGYTGIQYNGGIHTVTVDTAPIFERPNGPTGNVQGKFTVSGSVDFAPMNYYRQGNIQIGSPGYYTLLNQDCMSSNCNFSYSGWMPHGNHSLTVAVSGGCNENAEHGFNFFSDQTPAGVAVTGPSGAVNGTSTYITGHATFQDSNGCGTGGLTRGYMGAYKDGQGITTVECPSNNNPYYTCSCSGNSCDAKFEVGVSVGLHSAMVEASPCGGGVLVQSGPQPFYVEEYNPADFPICAASNVGNGSSITCEDTYPITEATPESNSGYNLITGALTQNIPLFSTGNGPLATDFRLLYDSNEQLFFYSTQGNSKTYKLPLSQGWTHSYDISLYTNPTSGQKIIKGAGLPKLFFTASGNNWVAQPGVSTTLVTNANGTYTATYRDGVKLNFTSAGLLTSIVDKDSNTVTIDRNTYGKVKVIDPQGRTTTLDYEGWLEKIVKITDPAGNVYDLTYNTNVNNMFTQIQLPAVNGVRPTWQFGYSSDRLLTQKTDPNGKITGYSYDGNRKLQNTTDPNNNVRQMNVGANGSTITEMDGGVWSYSNDRTSGLVNSKTLPTGQTIIYGYDSSRRVSSVSTPISDTTRRVVNYQYDAYNNVVDTLEFSIVNDVVQPVDTHTTATFDNANYDRVLTTTDVIAGLTTTYVYDTDGGYKRTRITNPLGAITSMHQNANGTVRDVAYPGGASLTYTYTAAGYVSTVTDNHNVKTEFSNFTGFGQPQTVKVYDAGNTLRMTNTLTYDQNGRVKTSTVAGTFLTTFGYDYMGNQVSVQDANGNTTSQTVNYKGQPVVVTNALGKTTTTGYTPTHRPASITDANGNITSFEYNKIGLLTKETPPIGVAVRYTYTTAGLIHQKINDSNNDVIVTYSYDDLGRLTGKAYLDGSSDTFGYTVNRLTSASSSNGSGYTFAYNANGTLQSSTDTNGNVVVYSYDATGRLATTTVNSTHTVTYGYTADFLTGITSNLAGSFGYTYDNLNRRSTVIYPNGITGTFSYDATRPYLLNGISYGSVYSVSYPAFDGVGNRTAKNEGSLVTFGYDNVYRLMNSSVGEVFTYDNAGNRLTDNASLYTVTAGNTLSAKGLTAYTYDGFGNTLTAGSWTYGWNSKNQLVSAVNGGTSVNFTYDSFGRRISKSVNGTTTSYLYDGPNIVASIVGGVVTHYVQGAGVDEHLAQSTSGVSRFFHQDGLGSVVKITDGTQSVVGSATYDSFGKTVRTGVTSIYGFTGREYDTETLLTRHGVRYLNADTGRWLSRDPAGFAGGDVVLNNYVGNNAINFIDVTGYAPDSPYLSQQTAAFIALNEINPKSIEINKEFSGMIYQNANGTYSYTEPNSKGAKGFSAINTSDPGGQSACPKGTKAKAYYHTHGAYVPGLDNEDFSQPDKNYSKAHKIDGYLGTPGGKIKYYNRSKDDVIPLGTIKVK